MSHPLVVHCKKSKFDVYIGRRCGSFPASFWANPFRIGKDGTREEVIEKYKQRLLNSPVMLKRLGELKGKVLGCWCAPLPCHGDVLAEMANESEEQGE